MTKLFPIILIILDMCASLVYFIDGDIKRGIYWIAAATLTLTVTL